MVPKRVGWRSTRPVLRASTDEAIIAERACAMPVIHVMRDDFTATLSAAQDAMTRAAEAPPYANALLANCLANMQAVFGDTESALQGLDRSRALLPDDDSRAFNRIYSETIQGILELQNNRLRSACVHLRAASLITERPSCRPGNELSNILYAMTLHETGNLRDAAHLLKIHMPLALAIGLPDPSIQGTVVLARIRESAGDIEGALNLILELEQLGFRRRLPRVVAGARLERARLFLRQDNLSARASRSRWPTIPRCRPAPPRCTSCRTMSRRSSWPAPASPSSAASTRAPLPCSSRRSWPRCASGASAGPWCSACC